MEIQDILIENPNTETILGRKLQMLANDKIVLEFGAGFSTIVLSKAARELVSVESDFKFMELIKSRLPTASNTRLIHGNIGPTEKYGAPKRSLRWFYKRKYPLYSNVAFSKDDPRYELVFVDGRFRVACMLQCALQINSKFTLVCDDFINRPEYHVVLEIFGKPIFLWQNCVLWNLNPREIQRPRATFLLSKYIYDVD